ncbi:uncharacterized protein LOC119609680 [Lucilia sericata]|uniref:uncharacterized protein LOC119609680 n=1 Tax=Lucilia sericata TaxID=13632 RepID=UPI0018A83046|nr:uncharacterized protein LOC119609680 [Lucilia sericata]
MLDYSKNKKDDMNQIVSKLAAVDGFSIRSITRSTFIRESMLLKGFHLPRTERDVQQLIISRFGEVKNEIIQHIESQLKNKSRFSLVMDEWTSIKNRRYLNICLYGQERTLHNLGMVYIPGKSGALEIRDLMETRLKEYNITFENHIVATTTDGPNVMKKFVRQSPVDGVFCLNHALHLAVVDVLYKKTEVEPISADLELSDSNEFEDKLEDDSEDYVFVINTNYKLVLEQTRRVIKLFRKSPTKNCVL